MSITNEKTLIGRREYASLPDFSLDSVEIKVDTGAYTSSIHVDQCDLVELNGQQILEVIFLDREHKGYSGKKVLFKEFRKKKVKSSTGQEQMRYFIKGRIKFAGRLIKTEFSLTQRKGMRYQILLGRKVLNKNFIVDTSRKHIHLT
jgi:hypothetical protein